jgi:hypothetical protein
LEKKKEKKEHAPTKTGLITLVIAIPCRTFTIIFFFNYYSFPLPEKFQIQRGIPNENLSSVN